MTVKLIFKGDVSGARVDEAVFPPSGGLNITVSADSPSIDRHDMTVISQGRKIVVQIDGFGKGDISSNTLQSIKDTIPTSHIQTRYR